MKRVIVVLYIVVIVIMATATIVERYQGTDYVADNIYGAWWFSALWALLTAASVFYFVKRKVSRPSVVVLHLSFVIILAGALLTHLTAQRGLILLRQGEATSQYLTRDMVEQSLPFSISLDSFEIICHEGTNAPADYISHVTIDHQPFTISMNQIVSHQDIRLYQSSYDEDMQGSILAMNSDPWGIPVTYLGYALLFVSLVWMLTDPRGAYRQVLSRSALAVGLQVSGQRLPRQRWLLMAAFLTLTFCLARYWIITGHIPMTNGYETLLFLAWTIMLITLLITSHHSPLTTHLSPLTSRLSSLITTIGLLLSGISLLVSHITQTDSQTTYLLPVLNTPLLTLHVSTIILAYALLALTFATSLTALCKRKLSEPLQALSLLMLYPAITFLALGIFIGAIWANISWGTYWSWDPKETWALITLMVYAIGVHGQSLPFLRQPKYYHLYMTLAFLTILMTYFGVNYYLGGIHSYA